MTVVQPAYVCDEAEARDLVRRWHATVDQGYAILLHTHEWKAWAALGYETWRDFAMTELCVSQSRAYQLLDFAKVVREIEAASSTTVELSEREARDLKPHLPVVAASVAEAVADVPEDERPAAAAAAVKAAREQFRPATSPPAVSEPAGATGPTAPAGGEPDLGGIALTREFLAQRRTGHVTAPPDPRADLGDDEWDEHAAALTEDGTVERMHSERPYSLAVIALAEAAKSITGQMDAVRAGSNVPATNAYRLDDIAAAHRYLTDFLAAAGRLETIA